MRLKSLKISVTIVLAGLLLLLLAAGALAAPPWSDASNTWWLTTYEVSANEVGQVADGFPDGTFRPAQAVTRGQFAKMAVNGLNLNELNPATPTFRDVARGSTFYTFVEGAYAEELIGGYSVTGGLEFRPSNNITRQQTNSILARYLVNLELDTTGVIHGSGGLTYPTLAAWYAAWGGFYLGGFTDVSQIAADHRATTAYLVYRGVVKGSNGKLSPTATLNRAQAAVMILRVADVAAEMTTTPPAPTALDVIPPSPGTDTTPVVTGRTIPGGIVHIYDAADGATTPVDLFAGVPDSLAPRADVSGEFAVTLPTLADGTHRFSAKVKNAGGLVSQFSASVQYVLDTAAPTGSITKPVVPAGQTDVPVNTPEVEFTVTAADTLSGVDRVEFEYSLDQATPDYDPISSDTSAETGGVYRAVWPSTGSLAGGLDDGQYLLRATVYDEAGNSMVLGPVKVTVDTKAPTAVISAGSLQPAETDGIFYTAERAPLFGAIAGDTTGGAPGTSPSGVAKVEFLYAPLVPAPDAWNDFTVISEDPGTSGFAVYPPAGIADGRYLFAVRATDKAGNQSALMTGATPPAFVPGVTQAVVIDNVDPTGAITAPLAGAVKDEQPVFTVSASDASAGVKQVLFRYALAAAPTVYTTISTDTEAPYEAVWGDVELVHGVSYQLSAVVTDKIGRTYEIPAVAIIPDFIAPTGTITAPTGGTVTTGQPTFTAEATDAGSGMKQVTFQYALAATPTVWETVSIDTAAPWQAVWATTTLANGDYKFRAVLTDNAGNSHETATVDVTVDMPPT